MRRAVVVACVALLSGSPLFAQTFQGRAIDDDGEAPIPTTLVRLIGPDGESLAVSAADSAGFYRINAPAPGVFRLEAHRIGYEAFRTPLLEARQATGVYPIDLVMKRSPVPIRGLTVNAERIERQLQLVIGLNPKSLRKAPIRYEEIQRSLEMGRGDLASLLRWSNTASLLVFRTVDGPCFSLRGSGCLPVYFNGMHYRQEILDVLPLDMVHAVLLLYPGETVAYNGGAVLLFSEAWIR